MRELKTFTIWYAINGWLFRMVRKFDLESWNTLVDLVAWAVVGRGDSSRKPDSPKMSPSLLRTLLVSSSLSFAARVIFIAPCLITNRVSPKVPSL